MILIICHFSLPSTRRLAGEPGPPGTQKAQIEFDRLDQPRTPEIAFDRPQRARGEQPERERVLSEPAGILHEPFERKSPLHAETAATDL